ncbi:hypothetical protein HGB07_07790 [Candidatus Roizmanbacteria bacterium]|nr:hypothetical protein [Candidatus Roizmanbacteria bacterium]
MHAILNFTVKIELWIDAQAYFNIAFVGENDLLISNNLNADWRMGRLTLLRISMIVNLKREGRSNERGCTKKH